MIKILIAVSLIGGIFALLIWDVIHDFFVHRREEKELNAIRFKAPTLRQKIEEPERVIYATTIRESEMPLCYTGEFDSHKNYKEGDVIIKKHTLGIDYYIFVNGYWAKFVDDIPRMY